MSGLNFKYTYTSSEDVMRVCLKRRSAYNIFNKKLDTPNESAEFARSQMLQRKGLGGTTIFITLEEETRLLALFNTTPNTTTTNAITTTTNAITTSTSNSASGLTYIESCPFVYRRKPVLPLTNKF